MLDGLKKLWLLNLEYLKRLCRTGRRESLLLTLFKAKSGSEFHYPALFPYDEVQHEESEVDTVLSHYLAQAKAENKAKLLWLIEGRKEYVWNSMLQMMMAHSLLSLESRAITAQTILDAFEIESESRGIEISDELMPDLELLKNSIEKAKDAAKANKKSIYGR